MGGVGGNGASVPSSVQPIEMYGYTQAGLASAKRLRVQEIFNWYVNGTPESSTQKLDLDATYTYYPGGEGKVLSVNYPTTYSWNSGTSQLVPTTGPTYTYAFDSMMRPTGLTDQSNNTDVSNVTYNAANQLLGLNYSGTAETRQYNNLNQMTNLTAGSGINIAYTFPAGANNGKISQQTNSVSGETVTYQYDSLNRLLSATSNQSWSETYGYDGFGNLLSKTPTGGAPTLSQSVNAANNWIVGVNYDANGNQTTGGYGYDAENRLVTATGIQYGYDSRNKRVWSGVMSGSTVTQTVYFYGVGGQRLGIYSFVTPPSEGGAPELSDLAKSLAVYFGGKRVGTVTNGALYSFTQDRLGSNGSYYPYGEARGTVPQDDVGFATYTNDSATGLQYADQRYYANNFGRLMSADRTWYGTDSSRPASWNRYAYVEGDPVNYNDPLGMFIPPPSPDPPPVPDPEPNPDPGPPPQLPRGGAPPQNPWLSALSVVTSTASIIQNQNVWKPNCQKDLAAVGTTTSALQQGAADAQFQNGTTSNATEASLYPPNLANGLANPNQTIAQDFASHPGTDAETSLVAPLIYIRPAFFAQFSGNPTPLFAEAIIIHELLHMITGETDPDLQRALGIPQTGQPGAMGSMDITLKILADCVP